MSRVLGILLWLGLAWLVWSGHLEPLMLGYGVASCALVLWLSLRMKLIDPESVPHHLLGGMLLYIPWLLLEIAKANLHVARVILTPSLPIQPRVIRVRATQRSELGNTIFANSITLTPGTVALDVRGGSILVHALTDQSAAGLTDGVMDSRVSRVEGVGDRE
jgi:multicomponent Na+:H+ antiporter subunit E